MNLNTQALQQRLIALGYDVGKAGADGVLGSATYKAMNNALDDLGAPKASTTMTTSPAGRAAISSREGNMLTAYKDGGGVLTIGVGHTSAAGAPTVTAGMKITAAESDAILARDLKNCEAEVLAAVKVPLTQNQFDALVSLDFNIGGNAFANSTLVKKLNAGDYAGAADQFLVWDKDNKKVVVGLSIRRAAERVQFLSA